ncbi:hypothetical protein OG21DRAFT_412252 [Imleria badia]|nr:hypothetical protein OG21DRAFT_412252 [Imleria badia]
MFLLSFLSIRFCLLYTNTVAWFAHGFHCSIYSIHIVIILVGNGMKRCAFLLRRVCDAQPTSRVTCHLWTKFLQSPIISRSHTVAADDSLMRICAFGVPCRIIRFIYNRTLQQRQSIKWQNIATPVLPGITAFA